MRGDTESERLRSLVLGAAPLCDDGEARDVNVNSQFAALYAYPVRSTRLMTLPTYQNFNDPIF